MLSDLIADEQGQGKYPLDLRAGKAPFTYKDNDVFAIEDLDGVFDFVEGSKEWFVDIYANTLVGKFPHADFTGSALTSSKFEEALKNAPKTAEDKFNARLKELSLWDDWCQQGCLGRVGAETSTGITILVHEDEVDRYTEFTYPPMSEMQKDCQFRINALAEFYPAMNDDKEFVGKLVRWVVNPTNVCPLFPVDVYFIWGKYNWQDFKDDVEEPKGTKGTWNFGDGKTEEICPHCDNAVELEHELKVQKCPNCGKWIVPCSVCPLEDCSTECPLECFARILNGE